MTEEACPPANALAALVEGALREEETSEVHRHVRSCMRCRHVLAGLGAASGEHGEWAAGLVMREGAQVGRFRLGKLVGRGGMGSVWSAVDGELGREVALKVLSAGLGSDGSEGSSRARLLREAKAMARLAHPNVVPVFDVGEVAGRLFIVMELVEGTTLGAWLKDSKAPHSIAERLELFLGAGEGLAAAHAAGVIHRDFKPDNVLVGKDGRPRVTDFGLARGHLAGDPEALTGELRGDLSALAEVSLDGPTEASALTPIGALLGTPAYMSPEQMRGTRAEARSDLFAFCTALFEALTSARPYPARSLLELRGKIEAGEVEWPDSPRLPGWLKRELTRGLRPNPEDRHNSMSELLAALRRGRAREQGRWLWLAAAGALFLVVAATAFGLIRPRAAARAQVRSLAVLSPRNGSAQSDAGWIGQALAELIAGELGGDAKMRLISGSEVAAALTDLKLRDASPLASDLPRLRTRLDADFVLGGKYRLADGQLDCELALWDPQGHAIVFSEQGSLAQLAELGLRLGLDARRALGMTPENLQNGAAAFPANLEAARLYAEGLLFARNDEAARATNALEQAAVLAPGNPRIQLALLDERNALHQDGLAKKTAQLLYDSRSSLAPDEQARAEILYRWAIGDHPRALELATLRYQQDPTELAKGLQLADLYELNQSWQQQVELAAAMHQLPPPLGNDARIDLAEANAELKLGELQKALAAADRAYASSSQIGARLRMATARTRAGQVAQKQGDRAKAIALLEEANGIYVELGDVANSALVRGVIATLLADDGDLPRAREELEAVLKMFVELEDSRGEASTLHNLAIVARRSHELPSALAYENRALTVNLEIGSTSGASNSLSTLGGIRQDMGDLTGASEALTRSVELRRKDKDPLLATSLATLAGVRIAQGNYAEAQRLLDEASALPGPSQKAPPNNFILITLELETAQHRFSELHADAERAAAIFKERSLPDQQALAETKNAYALMMLGHLGEARAAIDRARATVAKSKSRVAQTPIAVDSAMIAAAENPKHLEGPLEELRKLSAELGQAGDISEQWRVRVAVAQLELIAGKPGARTRLRALARDAREEGLELVAQQAEEDASKRPVERPKAIAITPAK